MESRFTSLQTIVNFAKKELADYVSTNLDFGKNIKGSIGLTEFEFLTDHLELEFNAHFDDIGSEAKRFRKVNLKSDDSQNSALEIMVEENFINGLLASLYHTDYSFKMRDMFGAASGSHEYSDAISMILSTRIIGQAWSQMIEEFGPDQPVDAECSFGKGLFENLIRNLRPSGFVFKENSYAEI